jgi:hypothetical protein
MPVSTRSTAATANLARTNEPFSSAISVIFTRELPGEVHGRGAPAERPYHHGSPGLAHSDRAVASVPEIDRAIAILPALT